MDLGALNLRMMNAKTYIFFDEKLIFLFSLEENNEKTLSHVKLENEGRKPIKKKERVEMCFCSFLG